MNKRVLVFGTFDGIHSGHEFFLRTAKSRGSELVVGVARDTYVVEYKGRRPLNHEQKRLAALEALPCVDEARLCDEQIGNFNIIEEVGPDLILLGHDQQELESALITWMGESGHYVPMIRAKKV